MYTWTNVLAKIHLKETLLGDNPVTRAMLVAPGVQER